MVSAVHFGHHFLPLYGLGSCSELSETWNTGPKSFSRLSTLTTREAMCRHTLLTWSDRLSRTRTSRSRPPWPVWPDPCMASPTRRFYFYLLWSFLINFLRFDENSITWIEPEKVWNRSFPIPGAHLPEQDCERDRLRLHWGAAQGVGVEAPEERTGKAKESKTFKFSTLWVQFSRKF